MANLKEVRTRIASVSSTQQITSAMKMVSAAKFRRAQNAILGMRPYAAQLAEIVRDIDIEDGVQTPYHETRALSNVLLIVVTSNKGLCGAFNSNVIKEASARLQFYRGQGCNVKMITLGKRGTEFFAKQQGLVAENGDDLLDNPEFDSICALCEKVMTAFCDKQYDCVEIIYNQFKNSLTQILSTEQFLPVTNRERTSENGERKSRNDYIYEPGKEQIMKEMIPMTLRSQFYRVVLDSLAAEHGARMTAMQKATDNATELLKELRLSYNKARQAAITNEIIEIVSGSEALKG
ncbi:MAG: ATP synthase F1 subunit gamma [Bacteroidales bacterium]|jgi:F-type H+-transporting ATPase subunit gamma|nr:ATP synthase F1 subunit gamma [Bacteroidales bacterium]